MNAGPYSGLLVLDLTRVLAGPYAALMMAELGARVIKIEPPEGDDARRYGPFVTGENGASKSGYFMSINRGKESIALDLKKNEDRRIFEALLAQADVLIENYRGGTMEKLGYGWDSLKEKYPRLIYAAVSGFGHTGPYAARPAYDMVVQAMGGIMSLTGHPGGPPTRVGTSIGDLTAALFGTVGIAAALYDREKTGRGQKVDVGMLDCQVAILENAIARYVATGEVPGPLGTRHPSIAPFAAFKTKDDYIVIAAGNDALFARVAKVLGREEWPRDPRFATNPSRIGHLDALHAEMESALAPRRAKEWLTLLEAEGVPCAPINDIAAVMADPQVLARNMIVTATDPDLGPVRMQGNPIKLSGYDDQATRGAAPDLDVDRATVLSHLFDGDTIASQLNAIATSDTFVAQSHALTELWNGIGVGSNAVDHVLLFMESHPTIDFGVPGPLVHFVERFWVQGYEDALIRSIQRQPTEHTLWMFNRLINGTKDIGRKQLYTAILESAKGILGSRVR